MEEQKDVIVTDKLGVVRTDAEEDYLAHLLCLSGMCRYLFNGKKFELLLRLPCLCLRRR